MFDKDKFIKVVKSMNNKELVKYYRTLSIRLVDETTPAKAKNGQTIIKLIKFEMKKRPEENDSSAYPGEGLMSTMGYRVGDTQGIRVEYRRMIMQDVLEGPIPFVDSPVYMREWGQDKSIQRYKKLKRFLSSEIHSPLQKNNYRAISEWKEDLIWLEENGIEIIEQ